MAMVYRNLLKVAFSPTMLIYTLNTENKKAKPRLKKDVFNEVL